jgi:hypothetical protein
MAHGQTRPFLVAGMIRALGLAGVFAAVVLGCGLEGVAAAGVVGELASLIYMSWRLGYVVSGLALTCIARSAALVPAIGASIAIAVGFDVGRLSTPVHLAITLGVLALVAIGAGGFMPALRHEVLRVIQAVLLRRRSSLSTGSAANLPARSG